MNILEKELITPNIIGCLTFVSLNTNSSDYIKNCIKKYLFEGENPLYLDLEKDDLITYIKGRKKDEPWDLVRLTDKSKMILKEMNQKPQHSLTEYMLNYTKKMYEKIGADKKYIQGGEKLKHYISCFLESRPSEYNEKMIIAVINAYISQFEYGDHKYLSSMKNLFFKPANAYATKYTNEDSPLSKFIENNQDKVKYHFKIIKNETISV